MPFEIKTNALFLVSDEYSSDTRNKALVLILKGINY